MEDVFQDMYEKSYWFIANVALKSHVFFSPHKKIHK